MTTAEMNQALSVFRDLIIKLERAEDSQSALVQWQPIATAPAYGKMLLYGEGEIVFAHEPLAIARSFTYEGRESISKKDIVVTHWMPLPSAPNNCNA